MTTMPDFYGKGFQMRKVRWTWKSLTLKFTIVDKWQDWGWYLSMVEVTNDGMCDGFGLLQQRDFRYHRWEIIEILKWKPIFERMGLFEVQTILVYNPLQSCKILLNYNCLKNYLVCKVVAKFASFHCVIKGKSEE